MKSSMICTLAAAAIVVAGCGKKGDTAPDAAKPADKPAAAAAAKPAAPAVKLDPKAVAITVNGKSITNGEIAADVEKLIEARKAMIPPEHLEEARQVFGEQLANQFMMKTILLAEADKKGIKVTDEDRKKFEADFLKNNAGRPDAPKSLKEAAKKHPFGEKRGLEELEDSFKIEKLIEQEVTSKAKVEAKDVDAELKRLTDAAAKAAKDAAEAGEKIKTLKKQFDGLKGDALAKKFAEVAKAESSCPSKEKGGDLGEFTHGQMVKEFDEVAFKLEPFTVSEPVKTQFGWHLIMVTKKIPAVAAKGDKPAAPEKVQASHILLMARDAGKAPTREEVEKRLQGSSKQTAVRKYIEGLRELAKISSPSYPRLMPRSQVVAPAQAKPAKAIESKPVEAKPAAKPVEAKPAAKPAEAAKPAAAPAKPAEAKK